MPDFDLSDLGRSEGWATCSPRSYGRRGAGVPLDDEEEIENGDLDPIPGRRVGGKVPVTLTLPQVCQTCSGSGGAPGTTFSTCPECKGRGTISFGQGGFAVQRPCPVCRGGQSAGAALSHLPGLGEVRVQKHLTITIPPGTEDGTRLRLKGQGAKGRGDIVVAIQVEPDRFFRLEDST